MPKAVQIAAVHGSREGDPEALFALADDGSVWVHVYGRGWEQVRAIPFPEPQRSSGAAYVFIAAAFDRGDHLIGPFTSYEQAELYIERSFPAEPSHSAKSFPSQSDCYVIRLDEALPPYPVTQ